MNSLITNWVITKLIWSRCLEILPNPTHLNVPSSSRQTWKPQIKDLDLQTAYLLFTPLSLAGATGILISQLTECKHRWLERFDCKLEVENFDVAEEISLMKYHSCIQDIKKNAQEQEVMSKIGILVRVDHIDHHSWLDMDIGNFTGFAGVNLQNISHHKQYRVKVVALLWLI